VQGLSKRGMDLTYLGNGSSVLAVAGQCSQGGNIVIWDSHRPLTSGPVARLSYHMAAVTALKVPTSPFKLLCTVPFDVPHMSLMMWLSLMSLTKLVPHETQCRTCQQACRASMWPLKVATSPFKLIMDCALWCMDKEACLSALCSLVHIKQT